MLIAQWIPLTLWFWDRLLAERTARNAALFLAFYLLNLTGGCYLAYMIHFPLLAILVNRAVSERRELLSSRSLRVLVPVGLVAGAAGRRPLPALRADLAVAGARRAPGRRSGSSGPPRRATSAPRGRASTSAPRRELLRSGLGDGARGPSSSPERALFAGFLPTVLFLVGAVGRWRRPPGGLGRSLGAGLALSGLLCFAPLFPRGLRAADAGGPRAFGDARPGAVLRLRLAHPGLLRRPRGRRPAGAACRAPGAGGARRGCSRAGLVVELAPRRLPWRPLDRERRSSPPSIAGSPGEPSVRALIELPIHTDARENQYIYDSTAALEAACQRLQRLHAAGATSGWPSASASCRSRTGSTCCGTCGSRTWWSTPGPPEGAACGTGRPGSLGGGAAGGAGLPGGRRPGSTGCSSLPTSSRNPKRAGL